MIHADIPPLDRNGLRHFGYLTGGMFIALFGILFPVAFNLDYPRWPWLVALVFWLWALLIPNTLKWFYHIWMVIGHVLGWINTRIVLGMIFYGMMTPIGWLKRLFGNNPLAASTEVPNSYRHLCQPRPPKHLEYPF